MNTHGFSHTLFTDLYELTMAQAFWQSGVLGTATFSFFTRSFPADRGFFVFAGLDDALAYLENLRFNEHDLAYLRSLNRFDGGFLDQLARLRFTGSVRAMREGTIFFVNEPVLEVTGPIIEAQLAETFVINQVNLQSILATKAARVRHAAGDRRVIDFAARRTQGIEAANAFTRASYLAGFDGTSNTLAGALYGIPVSGTMAHSYITSFPSEIEAFRRFAASFPDNCTLLVDTYDTLAGTRNAIVVAREMQQQGHRLRAIRLDSGDLLDLSRKTRALLDEAGLHEVRIFASGGLDEFAVEELLQAGAPIDAFGVGTKVGVSADAPWTDCVYKLVEYDGRPIVKLSSKKQTLPGAKQVFRFRDGSGNFVRDTMARSDEPPPRDAEPLLDRVMEQGKRLTSPEPLPQVRERFRRDFANLPPAHKTLRAPAVYSVTISPALQEHTDRVVQETMQRELTCSTPRS
jgi:nicotinate phosphoribosyltransferase